MTEGSRSAGVAPVVTSLPWEAAGVELVGPWVTAMTANLLGRGNFLVPRASRGTGVRQQG